ncbi:MAG: hypothetical protein WCO10_01965 [bacterium]
MKKSIVLCSMFLFAAALSLSAFSLVLADDNQKSNAAGNQNIERERSTTSNSTSSRDTEDNRVNLISTSSSATSTKENQNDVAENHRSEVSKYVQGIVRAAERDGGIGKQVRDIAREQGSTTDRVKNEMDQIEHRSAVKTFLIGTDYKNIGALRSEIVQTRNRIEQMTRLTENLASSTEKADMLKEIQSLDQSQTKLENFIKANENKFSLFGWFVRMFQ